MDAGGQRMLRERARLEQARLDSVGSLLGQPEVARRIGQGTAAALRQLLDKQRASYSTFLTSGDLAWNGLRQRLRAGDRVLAECLAVVAGAFTAQIPQVADACAEAGAIAHELYELTLIGGDPPIIPAEVECAGLASSVLRRRFPDYGVWDLPVVAHEFGHLVARDLLDVDPVSGDTSRPIAEFLGGRQAQTAELAADVFAVYVLGAAYVLTLVLHRMDPMAAAVSTEDASHPGDASRVAAVLYVLELLGASDVEWPDQYSFLRADLGEWWSRAQDGGPGQARLNEVEAARVRAEAERVWKKLADSKLAGTRYLSFPKARALANGFSRGGTAGPAASCRDVLNAVWLVRFRAWRDGGEVPDRVVQWAHGQLARFQPGTRGDGAGG